MEDEGRKALKRPLVSSASGMEDDGGKALKRPCDDHVENSTSVTDDAASGREAHVNVKGKCPCEDLDQSFVENPSSASATASASGTDAEVTRGSIFKILAGRKALKCAGEEDLVNSASATTGTKAEVTRRSIFKPVSLSMASSAYAYDDPSEIWYQFCWEEGRVVTKVKYRQPRLQI